jgi:hypothetical protein
MDNTTLSWRTSKYKIYKEQLLYDTEKARLPDTQPYAEAYKNAKVIMEPVGTEINTLLAVLDKSRHIVMAIDLVRAGKPIPHLQLFLESAVPGYTQMSIKQLTKIRQDNSKLRSQTKLRLNELHNIERIYQPLVVTFGRALDRTENNVPKIKRVLTKACPTTDCSGFLDDNFDCGLCQAKVCKSCHEFLNTDHECNPETLASIKAVHSEARPCPTCATLISKISGCDQMWCTQCKTTFSWRTGKVERGITHNPHYYEWMRRNGTLQRNPGDIPANHCNGFPQLAEITQSKPNLLVKIEEARKIAPIVCGTELDDAEHYSYLLLTNYYQQLIHINANYAQPIQRPDNFTYRVQLLAKELNIDDFKVRLQRVDKAYRKSVAKKQIYDMTYAAAGDLLRNCINGTSIGDTLKQLESLQAYSNTSLDRVEKAYSCKTVKYEYFKPTEENKKIKYWYARYRAY